MFEIEYKGANCIIISTKKAKVAVDPKLSIVGLKDVLTKGIVELVTESRFAIDDPDTKLVINSPGEYGVADIDILGVAARRHLDNEGNASTMYRIEIDGSRIGVIGNIHEKLSDEQLEALGVLDILVVPVGGGGYTLDAMGAASVVRLVNPKIVIPVHYNDKALKYEVPQDELSSFVAELAAPVEVVAKFKSKTSMSNSTQLTVVEITRS